MAKGATTAGRQAKERGDGSGSGVGGVQSVARSFELLELLADRGGQATLSDLAAASGLPLPTIHRLVRTLVSRGYVRQDPSRRYALGPRLIRLGETASQMFGRWARHHLTELVSEVGETANLAVLDTDQVVYVAQAPSAHALRMFTEVGARVHAHCTGVGKALLAQLDDDAVREITRRTGLPPSTEHTITDVTALLEHLHTVRERGYAVDDGEQELGVRCVAVPVPSAPTRTALSVSGPPARVTDELITRAVPVLHRTAEALGAELEE